MSNPNLNIPIPSDCPYQPDGCPTLIQALATGAAPWKPDPMIRLSRDLKKASITLNPREARFLVDYYYVCQEGRKASGNQSYAMAKSGEPHEVLTWLHNQQDALELAVKNALTTWAATQPICQWAQSITGIGPIIAAGLSAHIDMTRVNQYGKPELAIAGRIYNFAGIAPGQHWLGKEKGEKAVREALKRPTVQGDLELAAAVVAGQIGCQPSTLIRFATRDKDGNPVKLSIKTLCKAAAKRPWNAGLKTLTWKIGQSFMKCSGLDSDFYGKQYKIRKMYELARNERGDNAARAAEILAGEKPPGESTDAYGHLIAGHLPPAQIDARARRWAVKLFLSHYHHVAYRLTWNEDPPKPFAIGRLGHGDFIPIPNCPWEG